MQISERHQASRSHISFVKDMLSMISPSDRIKRSSSTGKIFRCYFSTHQDIYRWPASSHSWGGKSSPIEQNESCGTIAQTEEDFGGDKVMSPTRWVTNVTMGYRQMLHVTADHDTSTNLEEVRCCVARCTIAYHVSIPAHNSATNYKTTPPWLPTLQ